MGKLVLFLGDGTTLDILLRKERVTIGRRADNDVCLPHPAVSGEHAAVVTILSDSFLEDLGSTNGTLVNGIRVVKHFLRDHDLVDIGRQRLVYMSDEEANVELPVPEIERNQVRGLTETVERAKPAGSAPATTPVAPQSASTKPESGPAEHDTAELPDRGSTMFATNAMSTPERLFASGEAAPQMSASPAEPIAQGIVDPSLMNSPSRNSNRRKTDAVEVPLSPPRVPAQPAVRVLSGPQTGRTVPFAKDQLSVGRVGVQVAVIRKNGDGFRLVPLEGRERPRVNGETVAAEGTALLPGDTFEVAGVRLEIAAAQAEALR
ncbi:MAG: FHA domain-containing protein [Casimicrobiaceae bacterium]